MAWLIDPSVNEGVVESHVDHFLDLPDANGEPRHDGPPNVAKRRSWTRVYDALAEDVSWLVRELARTYEFRAQDDGRVDSVWMPVGASSTQYDAEGELVDRVV